MKRKLRMILAWAMLAVVGVLAGCATTSSEKAALGCSVADYKYSAFSFEDPNCG
jgi:hypothetical protein